MHEWLRKEIELFQNRRGRSRATYEKAKPRLPLGVGSNFRSYEPYPIFVNDGKRNRTHDLDGNGWLDRRLPVVVIAHG